VLKLVPDMRIALDLKSAHVRRVLGSFATVVVGRGVVQISAFVDQAISTFLGSGVMAAMTSASSINMLPISLFGMAISASELPALSRIAGSNPDETSTRQLSTRLNAGLEQIAFFIVPSSVAFFALGNVIVAALYQTGAFTRADSNYVWAILAGSGVGLLASTFGRLYASTYYALGDTKSPLRFALVRLLLTAVLGVASAFLLPGALGLAPRWGAVALTASAGVAGWIEFHLLRRTMNKRLGPTGVSVLGMLKLWVAAGLAAAIAGVVEWALANAVGPIPTAVLALGTYGAGYFALTALMRVELSGKIAMKTLGKLRR
jgi:putative peptidoglycan lipid II flippase